MDVTQKDEFSQVLDELDTLAKSGQPEVDELDALTKSLEAELGIHEEPLVKSEGEGEGEEEGEDDEEMEKSRKAEEAAEALRKSQAADALEAEAAEALRKSQTVDEDQELVLASEAYDRLQKSVHDGMGSALYEIDTLKKSMAALLNLNIKQAKVIGQLAASIGENEGLKKSIEALASGATLPNRALLGQATSIVEEDNLSKSTHSDVTAALSKAVQEGKVAPQYLSIFGTYKDVNRLPADVRTIIGQ